MNAAANPLSKTGIRMKIRFLTCRPAALFLGFAFACAPLAAMARTVGSGHAATEKREVSGFHAVDLRGFGDLEIIQNDTEGLTLTGDDNVLPLITTEVDKEGTLRIGLKSNESVMTQEKLRISLSVKSLDAVALSGSGNVHARELKGKGAGEFGVSLAGSGNVTVEKIEAGVLKVSLAGSGNVKLGGEAPEQQVDVEGSGDYDTAQLKSKNVTLSVSGSGDASVWATDNLDVKVSGSGDVEYRGKPTVKKKVSGSGSVEPATE